MPSPGYSIALRADTDDPEYIRGLETGVVWEHLRQCPGEYEMTVHATNAEMFTRMAEATARAFRMEHEDADDGHWMHLWFGEAGA